MAAGWSSDPGSGPARGRRADGRCSSPSASRSRGAAGGLKSVADVDKVVEAFLGTHGYDEAFIVTDTDMVDPLLAAVCKTLTGEDRLLVYLYCHGALSCAADGEPAYTLFMPTTTLSGEELVQLFADPQCCNCKSVLVVINACFSGAAERVAERAAANAADPSTPSPPPAVQYGRYV